MFGVRVFSGKWNHLSRSGSSVFNRLKPKSTYSAAVQAHEENKHGRLEHDLNGEYANVKWDELGFDLTPTDYMYIMKCRRGESFSGGTLTRFGDIEMSPSSGILNYGQGLFEGLKAYKTEDGRILLFRPEENAARMQMGAERMCMPAPTVKQFLDAVKQTVFLNKHFVPPPGKGSMYIRPLLMGSGMTLGLGPAPEYIFLAYASPVGNYHKDNLNLMIEEQIYRATPGGTGGVKSVTNYSSIYKAVVEAKAKGFSDVLFLDAATGKNIEEASASNIFIVKGNTIATPGTHGTILPGITRKSIIEIAKFLDYQVEEREIPVEELYDAEEVFCTGTAVVVKPVSSITYKDKRMEYNTGADSVSKALHELLTGIQTGRIEDKMGWTVELN